MKKLLLLTLIMIPTQVNADAVCFADAYGVKRHSPDAWLSWTTKMPVYTGKKCYYQTTKSKAHNHSRIAQLAEHRFLMSGVPDSNSGAAAPIPRPSPVTQPKDKLVFVTPSHLREPRQRWDELPEWQPKPNKEIEKAKFDLFLKQIFLGVAN